MARYRKRDQYVEAHQWEGEAPTEHLPDWLIMAIERGVVKVNRHTSGNVCLYIKTAGSVIVAHVGYYIIQGGDGEIYAMKPDIFEANYEPVTSDA